MRVLGVLIMVLMTASLKAQLLGENMLLLNDENVTKVGLQIGAESNSSNISNSILNSFFIQKDGFTSEDLRQSVQKLQPNNYAGANINIRLFYQQKLRRKPIDYYRISMEYTDLISARFSGDMLGLVMLGNSSYEDQTAEFDNVNFTNVNYQKAGFHIGKRLDASTRLDVGLSLLKGGRYQEATTTRGSLYTAPYGEYLDADINFNYATTEERKAWTNLMGYGAAMDVHWSFIFADSSQITAGANNLGMMNWSSVEHLSLDTSFVFEGLVIDNIFDTINLSTDNISPDSIENVFGVTRSTKSVWKPTPVTVFLQYWKPLGEKMELNVAAQYTYGIAALPLVNAQLKYKVKDDFKVYPIISYGGFGSYNVGFGLDKSFGEAFHLRFQTRFLDGIAMYGSKGGQGGFVSLIYNL